MPFTAGEQAFLEYSTEYFRTPTERKEWSTYVYTKSISQKEHLLVWYKSVYAKELASLFINLTFACVNLVLRPDYIPESIKQKKNRTENEQQATERK